MQGMARHLQVLPLAARLPDVHHAVLAAAQEVRRHGRLGRREAVEAGDGTVAGVHQEAQVGAGLGECGGCGPLLACHPPSRIPSRPEEKLPR